MSRGWLTILVADHEDHLLRGSLDKEEVKGVGFVGLGSFGITGWSFRPGVQESKGPLA